MADFLQDKRLMVEQQSTLSRTICQTFKKMMDMNDNIKYETPVAEIVELQIDAAVLQMSGERQGYGDANEFEWE